MWNFQSLSRPAIQSHGYSSFNRADGGSESSPSSKMMNAAIHKGVAVAVSGVTGGIAAYKGIPEIKGVAGFDLLGGLLLGGAEFAMMYKGKFGKATAVVGGASTGLLCHWSAVNGTIWGASKAKAESTTTTSGWDYENDSPRQLEGDKTVKHEPPRQRTNVGGGGGFDAYNGGF
jgi:hypothetical protein